MAYGYWIVLDSGLSVFWSMDSGITWTVDYLSFGLWIVDCLGQ